MDAIKKFLATLDNSTLGSKSISDILSSAVKSCSNFTSLQNLIDTMIQDRNNAGSAEKFLTDYCGIILDNEDTGAITGQDAGGSVVKTSESVVPESGFVDRNFTDSSFVVDGLTVRIANESTIDGQDAQAADFNSLSEKKKYLWQALHSFWVKGALDINAESFGNNFSFTDESSATAKEIYVYFPTDADSTYYAVVSPRYYPSTNTTYQLKLKINMKYGDLIAEDDVDGKFTLDSGQVIYFDATLGHEFTHAVMAANIPADTYNNLPAFVREGIAELTCGIDHEKRNSVEILAQSPDLLNQYLSNMSPNSSDYGLTYAAGYILFRYLNKQASENYAWTPETIEGTDGNDATYATTNGALYFMFGGNDTVWVYENDVYVDAGNDADYIYISEFSSPTITGGAGDDSIFNHGTQAFIYGNDNEDYISNFSSHVTIYGGAGNDSIFNNNATCSSVWIDGGNGDDYVSNFASRVTIAGGAGNDIIYFGSEGQNVFQYNSGDGNDKVYNLNSSDTVNVVGASYSTVTNGNDIILSVGSESTTLFGAADKSLNINGTKNSSVNSSIIQLENNVYTYGGGNKFISSYNQGEVVRLDSDYRGIDLIGNSFYVNSSSGQLEIKNARNKFIGYSAGDANVIAYSYVAGSAGNIDGRSMAQAEIFIGADNVSNSIHAGSGGSSLWGGNGGDDTLVGGDGYDEFFYTVGNGNDIIQNAASNDIVNLLGVSLGQISDAFVNESAVTLKFVDGGSLRVEGNTNVGYALGGLTYAANQSNGTWYTR